MRLYRMLEAVDSCPAPVVSRIQGFALGGGSGLVACSDVALAAPDVVFGFTEVRLGIIPAVISPFVFARIGTAAARRYFLTGERFGGEEALRIGLVDDLVDDLDASVEAICASILSGGPEAVRAAKRLARERPSGDTLGEIAATRRGERRGPGGSPRVSREAPGELARPSSPVSRVRRVLVLAGAIVVCDTMFFAALTPLLPEYADEFGLSKSGVGLLQAAYPLGVLAGSIPGGYAAARYGVKPTAIIALLVIAGTSVVFGFANSIVVLDIARFMQGVGSAFAWTAAFAWLIAVAPLNRRGALIGTVLGLAIGGALFGPALGALAAVLGTGPVFTAVGIGALGVAAAALLTDAPPRPSSSRSRTSGHRCVNGGSWVGSGSSHCRLCCSER